MGFVPFRGSDKRPAERATQMPSTELSYDTGDFDGLVSYDHSKLSLLMIVGISLGTLASIGAVVAIVIYVIGK